jgi:hypothetical protein
VKGKAVKPKQATGYEDGKIKLVINLRPNNYEDEYDQLYRIQNIFKKPNQEKPNIYDIFNRHLNTRGIKRVIFKKLTTKEDNKSNILQVTCEFWEYIPITIQTTKASGNTSSQNSSSNSVAPELNDNYEAYLDTRHQRLDKTKKTAAVDDDAINYIRSGRSVQY